MATETKDRPNPLNTARTIASWAEAIGEDRCPRCGGLMILDQSFGQQSFGFMDDTAPAEVPARRCVQCGEVIDPVILMNRTQMQQGSR